MKYHLSYNEQTGQFRIDETGKTIQTNDTIGFVRVAGGIQYTPLLTFAQTMAYCAEQNEKRWTLNQVQDCILRLHTNDMKVNIFRGNDF